MVMSAVAMPEFADTFTIRDAKRALTEGKVVVFACGLGQPFFSTDTAAAVRAAEIDADAMLMAKNIDYIYTDDPRKNPDAKLISRVEKVTDEMIENAGGAGTERGTGGMQAKLIAAQMLGNEGIPMMIVCGTDPEILYEVLDGTAKGTYFAC